jgi:hypothetical protein
MAGRYRLTFYANRSTPQVTPAGQTPKPAKANYGRKVSSRMSTDDEERKMKGGKWLRVDSKGKRPGDASYRGHGPNRLGPPMREAKLTPEQKRRAEANARKRGTKAGAFDYLNAARPKAKRRRALKEAEALLERTWEHRLDDHGPRHAHTTSGAQVRLRPEMTGRDKAIARMYLSKPAKVGRNQYHSMRQLRNILRDPNTPRHVKIQVAGAGLAAVGALVSPIPGDELIGAALLHHAMRKARGLPSKSIREHFEHELSYVGPQIHAPRPYEVGL